VTSRPESGQSRVPPDGGILVVDKPVGPTSHDVVARVRRALRDRRVGHTGTLDPLASGVLVLCVGPATRLSQFLVGADKTYRAMVHLGVETDSLDAEGEVVGRDEGWRDLDAERVVAAATDLVGPQAQVPPAYSAKRVDGERAHRRIRRGETIELEPVDVVVHALEVVRFDPPDVELEMTVSSGTFVRSLARDLAAALGTTGHVRALRRTRAGAFSEGGAMDLDALDAEDAPPPWVPPLDAVAHLPLVSLEEDDARRLAMGQRLPADASHMEAAGEGGRVRVEADGRLLAIAEVSEGALRPRKVFPSEATEQA